MGTDGHSGMERNGLERNDAKTDYAIGLGKWPFVGVNEQSHAAVTTAI